MFEAPEMVFPFTSVTKPPSFGQLSETMRVPLFVTTATPERALLNCAVNPEPSKAYPVADV
jgi:hypothetical protein